jgi:hypothetical protein
VETTHEPLHLDEVWYIKRPWACLHVLLALLFSSTNIEVMLGQRLIHKNFFNYVKYYTFSKYLTYYIAHSGGRVVKGEVAFLLGSRVRNPLRARIFVSCVVVCR